MAPFDTADTKPDLSQILRVFTRIGLMSFGGPAAQIAVMHKELVEDRPWLSEQQFLSALSFCMLLPGPEAMQLCTYAGWRLRGVTGGLIAGLLFILPGAAVMMALAWAYASWGDVPLVHAMFLGIKATVVVIVVQALIRLGQKTLKHRVHWLISLTAFLALYLFGAPFPLVIASAALIGAIFLRGASDPPAPIQKTPHRQSMLQPVLWLALWLAPVALAMGLGATTLADIGLFFSKLAVVSFGGAYAVLAYMAQATVETHGWVTPGQMLDGLGLAETTPGPLILVTQFIGFMTGYNIAGTGLAIAAALMTLWTTFVPCFLWIFTAAPHVDWLTTRPRLSAALSGITAAVVGVIANLSLWFALHVFFHDTTTLAPLSATVPVPTSLDLKALALTGLAAMFLTRISLPLTLLCMAIAGGGLSIAFG
ncbi:chromate efflux transporter [Aliiroseovarius marinus]|uniref:chromate efflux transporter n=1 Tax=Aliiroseovarius marinus TaxID=2500159 RepID=UPI003D7D1A20